MRGRQPAAQSTQPSAPNMLSESCLRACAASAASTMELLDASGATSVSGECASAANCISSALTAAPPLVHHVGSRTGRRPSPTPPPLLARARRREDSRLLMAKRDAEASAKNTPAVACVNGYDSGSPDDDGDGGSSSSWSAMPGRPAEKARLRACWICSCRGCVERFWDGRFVKQLSGCVMSNIYKRFCLPTCVSRFGPSRESPAARRQPPGCCSRHEGGDGDRCLRMVS
mmetsp:Transcript_36776/g.92937  ORF Transcript_36776/g.92937 Transcript_36776/m.92937 type:complete len:230 (+) Transcript_36776:135-824(+)